MDNTPKIIKIAQLICYLNNEHVNAECKVKEIKNARDNGEITTDEALELCLEFIKE